MNVLFREVETFAMPQCGDVIIPTGIAEAVWIPIALRQVLLCWIDFRYGEGGKAGLSRIEELHCSLGLSYR